MSWVANPVASRRAVLRNPVDAAILFPVGYMIALVGPMGSARWRGGEIQMVRLLFATLIVSVMTVRVSAAETYVCVGEQSTGFKWSGSAWERAGFHANEKFVISKGDAPNLYVEGKPGQTKLYITASEAYWVRVR
jgi:hypothetical protein